jgi:hypothetical protein
MGPAARGYEAEEIFHEEDPLRVMRRLEEEGWLKHLSPALAVAKANVGELDKLREVQTQLQMAGIHPDAAAANFPLLTAKLSTEEVAELKKSFVRPGFVAEIAHLETEAKEFATQLGSKSLTLPSQMWKMIHAAKPEAVLWVAYSSKSTTLQAKLKSFETEWPKARTKIPYVLMQEMRIVPTLENFNEVVELLFFELMDGRLGTVEELKAFLEPFSPPAPPPPLKLGRSRAGKKDAKGKAKKKGALEELALDPEDDPDAERDPLAADENDESELDEVAELVGKSLMDDLLLETSNLDAPDEEASSNDSDSLGEDTESLEAAASGEQPVKVSSSPSEPKKGKSSGKGAAAASERAVREADPKKRQAQPVLAKKAAKTVPRAIVVDPPPPRAKAASTKKSTPKAPGSKKS